MYVCLCTCSHNHAGTAFWFYSMQQFSFKLTELFKLVSFCFISKLLYILFPLTLSCNRSISDTEEMRLGYWLKFTEAAKLREREGSFFISNIISVLALGSFIFWVYNVLLRRQRSAIDIDKFEIVLNKSGIDRNKFEIDLNKSEIDLNKSVIDLNKSGIDLNKSVIDLNKSEIDLNKSVIDLNEREHFLKASFDRSEIKITSVVQFPVFVGASLCSTYKVMALRYWF